MTRVGNKRKRMMKKRIFLYTLAVFVCAIGLGSCIYDSGEVENGCSTYMSAVLRDGYVRMRAQVDHSINADAQEFEDRVNTLAMLVFPSGRMERTAYHYATASAVTATIPATKVTPGDNDIYFFANVTEADVKGLTLRSEVEEYLQKKIDFPAALNKAATATLGFPMSRVYYGQNIPKGYTSDKPYKWEPNKAGGGDLKPVSLFGTDLIQGKVGLVRACAKITIDIKGEGRLGVVKVEYLHAVKQYSMKQLKARAFSDSEIGTLELFSSTSAALEKPLVAYVPESLFDTSDSSAAPKWDTATDRGQNGVNYIMITMKSGKVFTVPVVHIDNVSISNYIEYAKGASANYNVVRNNHYHFKVTIPADAKELVVKALVLPWTLVESEISFGKIEFEKKFTLPPEASMSGDKIIEVHQQTPVTVKFKLKGPKGAIWRATLTNGLDFSLKADGTSSGGVSGIADPNTEYTMVITPLKPFEGTPRVTEFYITVNGKEVPLVTDSEEIGPGKRYVFKQVE
ncbi:hypothetical protein IX308_000465 [Porphyromonas levii]|nr:hypothetical protein [Porphyromonas levii]